jgi:hypothetical protein
MRNTNIESRNKHEWRKSSKSKTALIVLGQRFGHLGFAFRTCFGFRISCFEFCDAAGPKWQMPRAWGLQPPRETSVRPAPKEAAATENRLAPDVVVSSAAKPAPAKAGVTISTAGER